MGQFLLRCLGRTRPWWDTNVLITLHRDACHRPRMGQFLLRCLDRLGRSGTSTLPGRGVIRAAIRAILSRARRAAARKAGLPARLSVRTVLFFFGPRAVSIFTTTLLIIQRISRFYIINTREPCPGASRSAECSVTHGLPASCDTNPAHGKRRKSTAKMDRPFHAKGGPNRAIPKGDMSPSPGLVRNEHLLWDMGNRIRQPSTAMGLDRGCGIVPRRQILPSNGCKKLFL